MHLSHLVIQILINDALTANTLPASSKKVKLPPRIGKLRLMTKTPKLRGIAKVSLILRTWAAFRPHHFQQDENGMIG